MLEGPETIQNSCKNHMIFVDWSRASYEFRVGAFRELRIDCEKCELIHLKCDL